MTLKQCLPHVANTNIVSLALALGLRMYEKQEASEQSNQDAKQLAVVVSTVLQASPLVSLPWTVAA